MIIRTKPNSNLVATAGVKAATHHAMVGHYKRKLKRHDSEVEALKHHQEQARKALEKAQAKRSKVAAKLAHHSERAAHHAAPKPHPATPAAHHAPAATHPTAPATVTAADLMDAALRKEARIQRQK